MKKENEALSKIIEKATQEKAHDNFLLLFPTAIIIIVIVIEHTHTHTHYHVRLDLKMLIFIFHLVILLMHRVLHFVILLFSKIIFGQCEIVFFVFDAFTQFLFS